MISRIFCNICHCEIAISHFAQHEATRKNKKNKEKVENNGDTISNLSSPLRKKQRNGNADNNNDNLQLLTQETANIINKLENDEEANQQLTQKAANIINQLENESNDDDAHLTQEAIDIISKLEDNNTNNDDNNALLQSPANAQQLTRDSLLCLQDDEGWIENEIILAYFKEIVLAHQRHETLFVTPENFVYKHDELATMINTNIMNCLHQECHNRDCFYQKYDLHELHSPEMLPARVPAL